MVKSIIGVSVLLFISALGVVWFLYKSDHGTPHGAKISVVCTTSIVADAVKNVGGEVVDVYALMGPGVDPHTYHARESDVQKLVAADLIFYNGLHLEGKMGQLLDRMQERVPVCAVSDGIPRTLLRKSQFEGAYDPHVWFDVTLWMKCVEKIRDCLMLHDPAHQQTYRDNAERYLQKLQELDTFIRNRVALLPEGRRILITAHDAFSYFGRAYGFAIISLQGISTDSEVGAGDVERVVRYVLLYGVPAIFVEASIPQRNIEAVQNAVRAQGKEVVLGPTLYSDALGEPGTVQETYLGMVHSVVDNIVTALQGEK